MTCHYVSPSLASELIKPTSAGRWRWTRSQVLSSPLEVPSYNTCCLPFSFTALKVSFLLKKGSLHSDYYEASRTTHGVYIKTSWLELAVSDLSKTVANNFVIESKRVQNSRHSRKDAAVRLWYFFLIQENQKACQFPISVCLVVLHFVVLKTGKQNFAFSPSCFLFRSFCLALNSYASRLLTAANMFQTIASSTIEFMQHLLVFPPFLSWLLN